MSGTLFSPVQLGRVTLQNRVVMAPMTRSRSPGGAPGAIVAEYYGQRAAAGLIITEGTSPSPDGLGYARIPGLYNAEQAAAWKVVTDRVHAAGGHIFLQLMHTGRVTSVQNLPSCARVVGASAEVLPEPMWVDGAGMVPCDAPHALTDAEIASTIEEYAHAAELAIQAGFDGVELHGANGYLIDQFLNTASNTRTDRWGGSVENRIRFAVEAAKACAARIGADRVGIRISPYGVFNGMRPDAETDALYLALVGELAAVGLVYVHLVDHSAMGAPRPSPELVAKLRAAWPNTLVLSGGYDRARAEADLAEGKGDLVAFGRPFISNPDLVARMANGVALAQPDYNAFYTPGEQGYTDYPAGT